MQFIMSRGEQCPEVSNGNLDLGRKLLDACKNGETEEVRELMANGAPFTTDWLGTSPLHFAAQHGHTDTAEFLLRSGVSRDTRTKVERTPLHVSAQEGHLQIVSLLLTYGADIDARDLLKMTPLHWAVERGHYDVVECLLANGADVNLLSKFDKTPIDIARDSGRLDMIPLLEKYVNVSRPRQDNRTTNNNNNSCFPQKTRPTVLPNKSNRTAKIVKPIGSVNTNSTVKGTSTTPTTSSSSSCPTFSSTVIANLSKTNVDALKKLLNGTDIHLEVGSNHVLTTLAALAEATGQTTDNLTNNNSQLTAEALQWLDTHGATSALEKSMLNSSIENGGSNLIKLSSSKPDIELTSETFDSSGLADYDGSKVKVNFIDGSCERFHVAWLRDSCQCSQCVNPLTKDKKINPADIDFLQLRPIKMSNDGVNLKIEWIDGLSSSPHQSTYSLSTLHMFKGKFDGQSDPADGVYGPEKIIQPIPWDVEMIKPICEIRFDYEQLMTDETTLMNVLEGILHYGIVFIADAPTEKETVLTIARRIAYERTTGYGTTFDLVANPDPNAHFSYSSAPLELHTDLCYRERVPGIQLLHCIQSAEEGGESSFADGLYCGQRLQQDEPELFNILTTPVMFSFYDSQRGIWFRQKWPVIVTDEPNAKTIKEVNLSYFSMRAPLLPDDQMGTFFTAFRKFYNITRSPSNRLSLKLREGEVAIFNNRRIVHGREGYSQNEKRFLQGCYMDLDEIQGLHEKLSTKSNQR